MQTTNGENYQKDLVVYQEVSVSLLLGTCLELSGFVS